MSRWDIFDRERARASEPRTPKDERTKKAEGEETSVGRAGNGDSGNEPPERDPRARDGADHAASRDRTAYRDRGRTYRLRASEVRAMADIGKFRTIDLKDLARFVYVGDEARMRRDTEHLGERGLVEQKTVFRAHKTPREVVTLTEEGYRLLQRAGELPKGQRAYHGFVKAREINHDADLYNMYQREAKAIRERGGIPTKVRLDFELKAAVQQEKNRIKDLPEHEQRERLSAFAEGHGLTVRGMTIQVPDVQIEYETREGDLERANLELVSENYRGEGIRSKAEAGFHIYARGNDATRVRRALEDTRTVERILSI